MSVCTDTSLIRDQLRPGSLHLSLYNSLEFNHIIHISTVVCVGLTAVVKKRVCDLRWEVRDSTVEFLGQLMSVAPEALPSACCTTPLLQEALQDPESYVRASAVSSLAHSWQQEAASPQEQVGTLVTVGTFCKGGLYLVKMKFVQLDNLSTFSDLVSAELNRD